MEKKWRKILISFAQSGDLIVSTSRFWKFVEKKGDTECWNWLGGSIRGYGHFWFEGKTVKAHRWIYQQSVGSIPEGFVVMHKCDNPSCVNPRHLTIGTVEENRRDCVKKRRHATGDTHGSRTKPDAFPKGSKRFNAVLTKEIISQIQTLYVKGSKEFGTYGLAKKFNISQATVQRVTTGQRLNYFS